LVVVRYDRTAAPISSIMARSRAADHAVRSPNAGRTYERKIETPSDMPPACIVAFRAFRLGSMPDKGVDLFNEKRAAVVDLAA
jgi:hypothetical protein